MSTNSMQDKNIVMKRSPITCICAFLMKAAESATNLLIFLSVILNSMLLTKIELIQVFSRAKHARCSRCTCAIMVNEIAV